MALNVRLSDRARADIEDISTYLAENFSEKAKIDFLIRLTDQLKLISEMPLMFRASITKAGVRECVLNKHTIIYYQATDELVKVLTIRNTKRDNA
ncbi:type II toxin-antitoxin system RelE/ParE family toxin [Dyadobacter chenhuakuii]|uniref:Type II toxin-antitoxin system RelE/ParE family toxin n=1 Tax=Dyadobacter chenhuakuii TaxID=2909339 RepID=A0ABY4XI67_9BACT|nr:type II toxin-antitoxin system RelE/ParE family toxin [Dyadobacter chenhuakuii]MCF2496021.1 type II toxin-antitoxin system RelE/ParE family toxin [Dyadobacter chenhuakuii]USJ30088.1 type II toxin-antitoxin system RelE/ParE family toxin [Dyadobacter chenhuakuii]